MTLWVLLWVTVTTDFVVKFATVIVKAFIALLPRRILSLKMKVQIYYLCCLFIYKFIFLLLIFAVISDLVAHL